MQNPVKHSTETIPGVPVGIRCARLAFLRDFESLMANRKTRGKYVCYHLDKLVAITKDYWSMIDEVVAKNIPEPEYLILKVVPGEDKSEREALEEIGINPD
jgi:hypothetical protein